MQGIIEKKNRTNKTNVLFKMREIVMSDWQRLKNLCTTADAIVGIRGGRR